MKKIILIIFASLMFCNIGFAEYRTLEQHKLNTGKSYDSLSTFCVDGYKFLMTITEKGGAYGMSTVQFYEERDGKSLPAKC